MVPREGLLPLLMALPAGFFFIPTTCDFLLYGYVLHLLYMESCCLLAYEEDYMWQASITTTGVTSMGLMP